MAAVANPDAMKLRNTTGNWRKSSRSKSFEVLAGMQIDTMIRRLNVSRKFIRHSLGVLILLVPCVQIPAAQLQQMAVKAGCAKYQDPKTLEPLKKFKEPAMEKGCVTCHLDCKQLPADFKPESEFYLKAKEPALCLECHNTSVKNMKDLAPSHDHQPLGKAKCTGCHDPHSSNDPKILREFSHGPYKAGLCSACHPKSENGEVLLTEANGEGRLTPKDVNILCYQCHAQFQEEMEGTKSRHKLLSQDNRACVECHDPHASNQEYVLKKPVQDLCLSCHIAPPGKTTPNKQEGEAATVSASGQPDAESAQYLNLSGKYVHEPATKECLLCHDAHASEFPKELRAPVRDLCMDCHGTNSEKIIKSKQPFPLFGGLVSLPPKMFEKLTYLDLKEKFIHEPADKSCAFCHDAHGSDYPKVLLASVQDVCLACHGRNAQMIVMSEQPVPILGGKVVLPPHTFTSLTELNLAKYGHPVANHPVYAPATADRPELTCVSCHNSHSTSTGKWRLLAQQEDLCTRCHPLE
jgi:predicted CXXCH cytochrome family protein